MTATKPARPRRTPAQRRADLRAEAASSIFGVLPPATAEQLAKDDPRNDPAVIAILAEWSRA